MRVWMCPETGCELWEREGHWLHDEDRFGGRMSAHCQAKQHRPAVLMEVEPVRFVRGPRVPVARVERREADRG